MMIVRYLQTAVPHSALSLFEFYLLEIVAYLRLRNRELRRMLKMKIHACFQMDSSGGADRVPFLDGVLHGGAPHRAHELHLPRRLHAGAELPARHRDQRVQRQRGDGHHSLFFQ